jgi:hypothetical protein
MVSAINETMEKFREGAKEGRGFYSVIVGEQLRFLGLNDGVKEYADRLTAISEKLQENNLHTTRRASLLREQAALQEKLNKSIKPDMEGDAQSRRMAAPDAPKPKLPDISGGTTKPAGISAAQKLINDGLALYNDLMAESSGYSKTYTEDVTKLAAAYQATSMTAAQYAAALAAINAAQPGAVEAEKARLDAAKLNTPPWMSCLTRKKSCAWPMRIKSKPAAPCWSRSSLKPHCLASTPSSARRPRWSASLRRKASSKAPWPMTPTLSSCARPPP